MPDNPEKISPIGPRFKLGHDFETKKTPGISLDENDRVFVQNYINTKLNENQFEWFNFSLSIVPKTVYDIERKYLNVFKEIDSYLAYVLKTHSSYDALTKDSERLVIEFLEVIKNNSLIVIVIKNVRKYSPSKHNEVDDLEQPLALGFKLPNASKRYLHSVAEKTKDSINIYFTEGAICSNNIPAIAESLFHEWLALTKKIHHSECVFAEIYLSTHKAYKEGVSDLNHQLLDDAAKDCDYQYFTRLLGYDPNDSHNKFRDLAAAEIVKCGNEGHRILNQQLLVDGDLYFINHLLGLEQNRLHSFSQSVKDCAKQAYAELSKRISDTQTVLKRRNELQQIVVPGIGKTSFTLALVSGDLNQAQYFSKRLDARQFPLNFEVIVCTSNPTPDINVGSGGAQLKAFMRIVQNIYERKKRLALDVGDTYQPKTILDILRGEKIIIVPSGGDSQRNLFHTLTGKAFNEFSRSQNIHFPFNEGISVFDNVLLFLYELFLATTAQFSDFDDMTMMVTIPGDADLIVDFKNINLRKLKEGSIIGLAVELSPREASNHGVFVLDKQKQALDSVPNEMFHVKNFLQKPSFETMVNENAIYLHPKLGSVVPTDGALFVGGEEPVIAFAKLTGLCDQLGNVDIGKLEEIFLELSQEQSGRGKFLLRDNERTGLPGWDDIEIEFYDDIFGAFHFAGRSDKELEAWISKPKMDASGICDVKKTETRISLRRYLAHYLGSIPFCVILSDKCYFVDLGLMSKDLDVKTRRNDVYCTSRYFNSFVDEGASVSESSIYRSLVGPEVTGDDNTFISESRLLGNCSMGVGSALSRVNLEPQTKLRLMPGTVAIGWLFIDPLDGRSKSTIVFIHYTDDPKCSAIFVEPISQYILKKGFESNDLWNDIPIHKRTLWNAKLYVVGDESAALNQFLQIGMEMTAEIYKRWKASPRVSLEYLKLHGDYFATDHWITLLTNEIKQIRLFHKRIGGDLASHLYDKWREASSKGTGPGTAFEYDPINDVKPFYQMFGYSVIPITVSFNAGKSPKHGQPLTSERPRSEPLLEVLLPQSPDGINFSTLKLRESQLLCKKRILGKEYRIITNTYPLFAYTFLRINGKSSDNSVPEDPQFLTHTYLKSSLVLVKNNPALRLWFNSLGAAASINSLHEQGVAFKTFPIESETGIFIAEIEGFAKDEKTSIHILDNFPSHGIAFRSEDYIPLSDVVYLFIQSLQIKNIGHNLMQYYDSQKNELVVIVFVRKKMTENFALGINLASPELSGLVTVNSERYIKDVCSDPSLVIKGMEENVWKPRALRVLLKNFVELMNCHSIRKEHFNKYELSRNTLVILIEGLNESTRVIRERVIKAIGWNGTNYIKKKLIEVALDDLIKEEKRVGACYGLSLIGTKDTVDTLSDIYQKNRLTNVFPLLRQASIFALINIGGSKAIEIVILALNDEWWSIQIEAALGLGRMASPETLNVRFFTMNQASRAAIRNHAVTALCQTLAINHHPLVQRGAAISLGDIELNLDTDKETIDQLMKLAKDNSTHWQVRAEAIKSLGIPTQEAHELQKNINLQKAFINSISVEIAQFNLDALMNRTLEEVNNIVDDGVCSLVWERNSRVSRNNPFAKSERLRSRTFEWLPKDMLNKIDEYVRVGDMIRSRMKDKEVKDIVVIGIGGATFGNYIYRELLYNSDKAHFHILDTSHPAEMESILKRINPENTLVIYSSKGGGAITPRAVFKCLYNYFQEKLRNNPKDHFVVITDANPGLSQLYSQAIQLGILVLPTIDNVGGRFSVLSTEMLFIPAAFGKAEIIKTILSNCVQHGIPQASPLIPPLQSPGILLGAFLTSMHKCGRSILTLIASSEISEFRRWCEMVVSENLCKEGTGFIPIVDEEVQDHYRDNRFFLFLATEDDASVEIKVASLRKRGFPVFVMTIPKCNPVAYIGELFYAIEWATIIAGYYMEVDPFSDPAFHSLKANVERILKELKEGKQVEDLVVSPRIGKELFGNMTLHMEYSHLFGLNENGITKEELGHTLKMLGADYSNLAAIYASIAFLLAIVYGKEYAALLPYLYKGDNEIENPLYHTQGPYQNWRRAMGDSLNFATIVREGPRFQHWLYQLLSQGPNTGFFTVIYERNFQSDRIVPAFFFDKDIEAGLSLGQVTKGKAIGTAQSLINKGKPVVVISIDQFDCDSLNLFFKKVSGYLERLKSE